jgi:hypothetical protein
MPISVISQTTLARAIELRLTKPSDRMRNLPQKPVQPADNSADRSISQCLGRT